MKRFALLLITLATVFSPMAAKAESPLLNGQKHYYTVQLRSDKRAIVYARIVFENSSADKDLATYEFALPKGVSADNLSVQQILAKSNDEKTCRTYETIDVWRARMNKGAAYNYNNDAAYPSSKQCVEWQDSAKYNPDYDYSQNISGTTDYYYYRYYQTRDTKFDYVDLSQKNDNGNYTVALSEPLKPKKQGSLLVSFTTNDFVKGGVFGKYDYKVQTLLAKQMVDNATVSVNFDEDMFSREATQKRESVTPTSLKEGASSAQGAPAYQSNSMDNLIGSVGKGGIYVKSQASLLPGDTLTVKGVFATNPFVMYDTEWVILLLALAIIAASVWQYSIWRKKHPRKSVAASNGGTVAGKTMPHNAFDLMTASSATAYRPITLTTAASILGTILCTLLFSGVFARSSYSSGIFSFITVMALIVIVLFGTVLLPGLYMFRYGAKNLFKWAVVQFATILALLLVFSLLAGGTTPVYD